MLFEHVSLSRQHMPMGQNVKTLVPKWYPEIAGGWMLIPLNRAITGFDP